MTNKTECLDASFAHPTFNLRPPLVKSAAIKITERNGDIENVLEFATADDYAAYKRIKDGHMDDEMRRIKCAEIAKIFKESLIPCYWAHMRRKNKI